MDGLLIGYKSKYALLLVKLIYCGYPSKYLIDMEGGLGVSRV